MTLSLVVALLAAQPAPSPTHLVLAGTTDLHGWFMGHPQEHRGGSDVLAGYLSILRRRADAVVLVDSGDMFQGTLASNRTEGAAVIELMNALSYDAAAVGNHEFDFGPAGPHVEAAPGEDPVGALEARMAQARFPILSANIVEKATGKAPRWARASTIVQRSGWKVGIVGITTPETPEVTLASNVAALSFEAPGPAVLREAAHLRAQGADLVVLISHLGATCTGGSCEGPLLELVKGLPPGTLDAAFGGHTHRYVATFVNGVPVVEAGAMGDAFGTIDLFLDPATRRPIADRTRIEDRVDLCERQVPGRSRCAAPGTGQPAFYRGEQVHADPAVTALEAPRLSDVALLQASDLGARLPKALRRDASAESALGDLVADSMLAAVPGADVAITNSGGIRADLPAGPLTYGAAFEVIPFDNRLAVLEVTGSRLRELVRAGFTGLHGILQIAGAHVDVDMQKEGACAREDVDGDGTVGKSDRDRIARIEVAGKPLDPARRYRVVTNEFLAGGGDGFRPVMRGIPGVRMEDRLQRDALVEFLRGRGTLPSREPEGRIIIHGEEPRCAPGR